MLINLFLFFFKKKKQNLEFGVLNIHLSLLYFILQSWPKIHWVLSSVKKIDFFFLK